MKAPAAMQAPALDRLLREQELPDAYRSMVETIHRPLAEWLVEQRKQLGRTLIAGVCGTQGSGKSTLCAVLKLLLEQAGLSCAVVSLDDLYLTHEERAELACTVHPLLQTRGVPGTHDVRLGAELLDALSRPPARVVALPRFVKAHDTRAERQDWDEIEAPVDVILFEGWCIAATAQAESELAAPVNALERDEDADLVWRRHVNAQLASPYRALFGRLDRLIFLRAPSFEMVFAWRARQEEKLARQLAGQPGAATRLMHAAALTRFIMHYQRLTEHLLRTLPGRADIVLPLDENQRILSMLRRAG